MPLSQPVAGRERLHTRRIELQGFRRPDGLFDIEARLTDTKDYAFSTDDRASVEPGEPLHGMSMRMTIDDTMTIVGFEAVTDYSPYSICPQITPNYANLVGLTIGRGFMRAVAERVGGVHGCTHLRELMQPMATVAFQTNFPMSKDNDPARRPALLNTCYAFRDDGPVVQRRWPLHAAANAPG